MSIMYKLVEPVEVGIGESMPTDFIKEAERSRARTIGLTDEIERLKAENAKLRELMADMLRYYAMPNDIDYKREAALLERARELGVETKI